MAAAPFPGTARQPRAVALSRLLARTDFLAARRGREARLAVLSLQARDRGDGGPARIGLTVTRRTGTAVTRNRIKRRLRAAIAGALGLGFRAGYDYVVIARERAAEAPFADLAQALVQALDTVHRERRRAAPADGSRRGGDGPPAGRRTDADGPGTGPGARRAD